MKKILFVVLGMTLAVVGIFGAMSFLKAMPIEKRTCHNLADSLMSSDLAKRSGALMLGKIPIFHIYKKSDGSTYWTYSQQHQNNDTYIGTSDIVTLSKTDTQLECIANLAFDDGSDLLVKYFVQRVGNQEILGWENHVIPIYARTCREVADDVSTLSKKIYKIGGRNIPNSNVPFKELVREHNKLKCLGMAITQSGDYLMEFEVVIDSDGDEFFGHKLAK